MRVAEYSPMKRGLKVNVGEDGLANGDRCRVFPDEEGTESNNSVFRQSRSTLVAEYSPMKRGLKGLRELGKSSASALVAEYSPMKRGLKEIQPSPDAAAPGSLQSIPR